MPLSLPFSDRLRIAGKAALGLFNSSALSSFVTPERASPPVRGTKAYLESYSTMPWLRAVENKISSSLAAVAWQLFVETSGGKAVRNYSISKADHATRHKALLALRKENKLQEIPNHPCLNFLEHNNPHLTGYSIKKLTSINIDLVGEAYLLKERNVLRMPVTAWPLPPHWVEQTPTIKDPSYTVSFPGWQGKIPDSEIVRFVDPDPVDPYGRGSGTARSLADELETHEYAAKYQKSYFYNDAKPGLLIYGDMGKSDARRLEEDWVNKNQGFFKKFKPYFLNHKGINIHEFQQDFSKMQMSELRQSERDVVMQVLGGMPPEMLGIVEGGNSFARIDSAEALFARWVLMPRLEFMRSVLQTYLLPDFDDRLILHYQSPVPEDKEYFLKVATVAPWSFPVDEYREAAGKKELPNGEGKIIYAPISAIPMPVGNGIGNMFPALPALDDIAASQLDGKENYHRLEAPRLSLPDKQKVVPIRKDAEDLPTHIIASRIEPTMRRVFLEAVQAAREKATLQGIEDAYRSGDRVETMRAAKIQIFADNFLKIKSSVAQAFNAAGVHEAGTLSKSAAGTIRKEDIELTFNLSNPRALSWIRRHSFELIAEANESTQAAIRNIIAASFEEQFTADHAAKLIRNVIGLTESQSNAVMNFSNKLYANDVAQELIDKRVEKYAFAQLKQRSITIARTESITASNAGQHELWEQAADKGMIDKEETEKEWLITDDDRLDTVVCEDMEGQKVRIDEPFITGDGRKIMHPTAHPRCRCAMRLIHK